jgi:uncharacterized protein involved in type VI secretion and phage assembly
MSTPYDGYVRLQKREVDCIRLSISIEVSLLAQAEQAAQDLAQEVQDECAAAAGDWSISPYAYLRARAARSAQIALSLTEHETALARLRQKAGDAYGKLRVAEDAARLHRLRLSQARGRKEQAEADDLSSARLLLRLRREKRAACRFAT